MMHAKGIVVFVGWRESPTSQIPPGWTPPLQKTWGGKGNLGKGRSLTLLQNSSTLNECHQSQELFWTPPQSIGLKTAAQILSH